MARAGFITNRFTRRCQHFNLQKKLRASGIRDLRAEKIQLFLSIFAHYQCVNVLVILETINEIKNQNGYRYVIVL